MESGHHNPSVKEAHNPFTICHTNHLDKEAMVASTGGSLKEDGTPQHPKSRAVVKNPVKVLTNLSDSEQLYILEGCRDNCRLDGRARTDLRPFTVLTGDPLILSHGSSRVFLSTDQSTQILCSVKAELVRPAVHNPHEGTVELHVDWLLSSDALQQQQKRQQRLRRTQGQQLQSMLSFLLQKHLCPLESLCVVPHHYAWKLSLDVLVLSSEGGAVVDLASRAMRAALFQTKLPHIVPLSTKGKAQVDLSVDGDMQKARSVLGANDDDDCPVVVSVAVLQCPPRATPVLVLDPTLEEELCASCIVHVAVTRSLSVVAIENATGSVPFGSLPDITATAAQAAKQVFESLDQNTIPTSTESLLQEQFRKY